MKPCPFCGEKNQQGRRFIDGSGWYHTIRCGSCGAEGPKIKETLSTCLEEAEKRADEEWEFRV